MRLRILLLGIVAAAAMAAVPGALASGRNPQTAGLQVALRAQGLYRGPIDALSGPGTVAAVRAFQRIHGLPVTGLANSRTRKALGPLGRPLFGARTLHRGVSSPRDARAAARPVGEPRVARAIGQAFDRRVAAEAEVVGARGTDRPATSRIAQFEQ